MRRDEAERLFEILKEGKISKEEAEVISKRLKENFPDIWEEYVLWKVLSESEKEIKLPWKEALTERKKIRREVLVAFLSLFLTFVFFLFLICPPLLDFPVPKGWLIPRSFLIAFLLAFPLSLFLYER